MVRPLLRLEVGSGDVLGGVGPGGTPRSRVAGRPALCPDKAVGCPRAEGAGRAVGPAPGGGARHRGPAGLKAWWVGRWASPGAQRDGGWSCCVWGSPRLEVGTQWGPPQGEEGAWACVGAPGLQESVLAQEEVAWGGEAEGGVPCFIIHPLGLRRPLRSPWQPGAAEAGRGWETLLGWGEGIPAPCLPVPPPGCGLGGLCQGLPPAGACTPWARL